jgi:hypothetical protein
MAATSGAHAEEKRKEGESEGEVAEGKPAREKEEGGGDLIPSSVDGRQRASPREIGRRGATPASSFTAPRRRQGDFTKSPLGFGVF